MRIVNEFHEEIENFNDFEETCGKLVKTTTKVFVPEVLAQKEISHLELKKNDPFIKVVDKPGVEYCAEHYEDEEVLVYKPYSQADILRRKRAEICFPIINRGKLWYSSLTFMQETELLAWYKEWLDSPETLVEPKTPVWVNEKIKFTEVIL